MLPLDKEYDPFSNFPFPAWTMKFSWPSSFLTKPPKTLYLDSLWRSSKRCLCKIRRQTTSHSWCDPVNTAPRILFADSKLIAEKAKSGTNLQTSVGSWQREWTLTVSTCSTPSKIPTTRKQNWFKRHSATTTSSSLLDSGNNRTPNTKLNKLSYKTSGIRFQRTTELNQLKNSLAFNWFISSSDRILLGNQFSWASQRRNQIFNFLSGSWAIFFSKCFLNFWKHSQLNTMHIIYGWC